MTNAKNVLLIVCDQLRADFLSCYGGPNLTPNIDRLGAQSLVFDRAWTPTPVCVPARMTLLTGMHGLSCPLKIPESVTTLPMALRATGYHTAGLGKFHLVPPRADVGFDEMILAEDTGTNMVLDDYHPELARAGQVEWAHGLTNHDVLGSTTPLAEEKTITRWNGDHAVRYLTERAENDAPFYGVVSFLKPHPPYDPPPAWLKKVDPDAVPKPFGTDRPLEDYPETAQLYCRSLDYDKISSEQTHNTRRHYLALVAQIDHEVGRILDTLEQNGQTDNTVVIFTSDHGDFLGDHHLFMKFYPHEPSAKIPLMIRAQEIQPGRTNVPASLVDIAPTILSAAGLEPLPHHQGRNLLHLATKNERDGVLIKASHGPGYCWATRTHKYTAWGNSEEELYDLTADPNELNNIASSDPDTATAMRTSLIAELAHLDNARLAGMPACLRDGTIPHTPNKPDRFAPQGTRFLHHRKTH